MVRQPRNVCRWFRDLLLGLLWLGLCPPGLSAAPELLLDVTYTPPKLTVVVQGLSLPQVLREIGARVGFVVVDRGAVHPALHITITDATLHDALRQLLQGENYAIVYRERSARKGETPGEIARIVLLGPIRLAETPSNLGDQQPARAPTRDVALLPHDPLRTPEMPLPGQPTLSAAAAGDQTSAQHTGQPDDTSPLENLLRAHALSGSPALAGDGLPETLSEQGDFSFASLPLTAPEETTAEPSPTTLLLENEAALAMTTRLAQHNLAALITGLTTATHSLFDSLAEQRR